MFNIKINVCYLLIHEEIVIFIQLKFLLEKKKK
jgi:hypothetical protein